MPIACGLYYHIYQNGEMNTPPVVLLHGAGGSHQYWPAEVRRLQRHRVYALDLPGHGKSEQSSGCQSVHAYADQVLNWMSVVDLRQAVFVGHGMGGAIALELALTNSEHVLGLGLLAAGSRLPISPSLLADAANSTTFYKAVDELAIRSHGDEAGAELASQTSKRLSRVRPSVLHGDLVACNGFDCTDRLVKVSRPVLVLCGAEDQVIPLRYSQVLANALPQACLEIIPRAGHLVMLEQPLAVARALETFLKQIHFHPGGVKYRVHRN